MAQRTPHGCLSFNYFQDCGTGKKFSYLGVVITEDGGCEDLVEIKARVVIAKDAFNKRRKLLGRSMSKRTKRRIIKAVVCDPPCAPKAVVCDPPCTPKPVVCDTPCTPKAVVCDPVQLVCAARAIKKATTQSLQALEM